MTLECGPLWQLRRADDVDRRPGLVRNACHRVHEGDLRVARKSRAELPGERLDLPAEGHSSYRHVSPRKGLQSPAPQRLRFAQKQFGRESLVFREIASASKR